MQEVQYKTLDKGITATVTFYNLSQRGTWGVQSLNIWLWLRSWSHGLWVQVPHWMSLSPTSGEPCFSLCPSWVSLSLSSSLSFSLVLSLSAPHSLVPSLPLSLKKKKKKKKIQPLRKANDRLRLLLVETVVQNYSFLEKGRIFIGMYTFSLYRQGIELSMERCTDIWVVSQQKYAISSLSLGSFLTPFSIPLPFLSIPAHYVFPICWCSSRSLIWKAVSATQFCQWSSIQNLNVYLRPCPFLSDSTEMDSGILIKQIIFSLG